MDIIKIAHSLRSFTDGQLSQELQRPSGRVPSYLVLAELNARKEKRPKNPPKTTVVQDISALIPPLPGAAAAGETPPQSGSGLAALANQSPGPGYKTGGRIRGHTPDLNRGHDPRKAQKFNDIMGESYNAYGSMGEAEFRAPKMPTYRPGREGPDADWRAEQFMWTPDEALRGDSWRFQRDPRRMRPRMEDFAGGGQVGLPQMGSIKSVARENFRLNPMPMPMRGNFLSTPAVGNNWFGPRPVSKGKPKNELKRMPYDRQTVAAGIASNKGNFQNFAHGGIIQRFQNGSQGPVMSDYEDFNFGFDDGLGLGQDTGVGGDGFGSRPRQYAQALPERRDFYGRPEVDMDAPGVRPPPAALPQRKFFEPKKEYDKRVSPLLPEGTGPGLPGANLPPAEVVLPDRPLQQSPPAWPKDVVPAPQYEEPDAAQPRGPAAPGRPGAPGAVPGTRPGMRSSVMNDKTWEDPENIYAWLRSKEPKEDAYAAEKDELSAWKTRLTKTRDNNRGMMLMNAGLGMMASKSPWVGQALGEAGQAALKDYSKQESDLRHDEIAGISASAKLKEAQHAYGRGEFDKAHKALDEYRKHQQTLAMLEWRMSRTGGLGVSKTDIKEIDQQNLANRQARNNADTKQSVRFELYQKLKRMPTEQELSSEIMRRYPVIPYRPGAPVSPAPGISADPNDRLGLYK